MILAYTGTPGSGKSYHAVVDIWKRVQLGYPVITNIPMEIPWKRTLLRKNEEKRKDVYVFKEVFEITPKFLEEFSEKLREAKGWKRVPEEYITLVIDEAQLIFNCRDWQVAGRSEWLRFFQLHRKLGYKIILITQICKMLDNQLRGLLEYEIIHRKASNFGIRGFLLSLAFGTFTLILAVRVWSVMRERIDCQVFRYSRRIARMYDTARIYSAGE